MDVGGYFMAFLGDFNVQKSCVLLVIITGAME
jgi:hypothetical protein